MSSEFYAGINRGLSAAIKHTQSLLDNDKLKDRSQRDLARNLINEFSKLRPSNKRRDKKQAEHAAEGTR